MGIDQREQEVSNTEKILSQKIKILEDAKKQLDEYPQRLKVRIECMTTEERTCIFADMFDKSDND